jgi:hypothetical protein
MWPKAAIAPSSRQRELVAAGDIRPDADGTAPRPRDPFEDRVSLFCVSRWLTTTWLPVCGETFRDALADAGRGACHDRGTPPKGCASASGDTPGSFIPVVQRDRGVLTQLGDEAALAAKSGELARPRGRNHEPLPVHRAPLRAFPCPAAGTTLGVLRGCR